MAFGGAAPQNLRIELGTRLLGIESKERRV